MLTTIVHAGKPCRSVRVLHLGQEMEAKMKSSKKKPLGPDGNKKNCYRDCCPSGQLIDYRAHSLRKDGERPGTDLKTKHTCKCDPSRVGSPGLDELEMKR
jgi:hypothetical protein